MSTVRKFSVPRGTSDILPQDSYLWQHLEQKARSMMEVYGYREIRTPYFEETALFTRSLGQTSDVVNKQLLNISQAKKETSEPQEDISGLSLRPEGTASIVRSYIENDLDKKEHLSKLYYIGPMFRGERPQKGRLRQFHQIGVEAIGPETSIAYLDAELIALSTKLLEAFGVSGFKLKINSLGTSEDKQNFSSLLRSKLQKDLSKLCPDCQGRFERNVFRILDCKNPTCRDIVAKLGLTDEHLSESSRKYFAEVKDALKMLKVPFEVSATLVRGLDYYTHTVFEISHSGLGSQDALGAGGRYNGLVQELGGDPKGTIGAIGFALGIERILLARQNTDEEKPRPDFFIVALDAEGKKDAYLRAFQMLEEIRSEGISAEMNFVTASMKSQMRLADKLNARNVIILGEDELNSNTMTIKDMTSGEQKKIPQTELARLLNNLKK